ncbi:hypothetical protein TYRP_019858 [Tyrophagus putrescentiae]|nr:hypothetical protein TYRP_019858 [Tyrophagus putrescentiae]
MLCKINPSFAYFLVLFSLLAANNVAGDLVHRLYVEASTDVPANRTVLAGEPFTIRCEIKNLAKRNATFDVNFQAKNYRGFLAYFKRTADREEATFVPNELLTEDYSQLPFAQISQRKQSLSVYEVTFTTKPNASFSTEFSCYLGNDYQYSQTSDGISIRVIPGPTNATTTNSTTNSTTNATTNATTNSTTNATTTNSTAATPQLRLISEQSTVYLNQPTKITCSLTDFDFIRGQEYFVKFRYNQLSPIAVYAVDAFEKVFAHVGDFGDTVRASSSNSHYPNFTLIITEKILHPREIWCELQLKEEPKKNGSTPSMYVSPSWKPYGPFVQFSSNKTAMEDRERLGRCTVDDLDDEDSRLDFQVQFYSDLGPKEGEENLLAQYSVAASQTTEFNYKHYSSTWNYITAGQKTSWPDFEVVAQFSSWAQSNSMKQQFSKSWWCVLTIGAPDSPDYRMIRSNKEML